MAGPGDIDIVADIVADAFDHLDVIHYLVPKPDRRRTVSRDWYRLYVAHAIGGAGQVVMTEDASAAAVWFDRTREASGPEGYEKHLAGLAGDDLPQFQHLDLQMEASHPTDPHWHLLFLAVRPDRWSQGLGGRLMDYTHSRLDAEGVPAYLEATGEQNRELYRRHGYMDMSPPTIAVTDTTLLYRMWRPVHNG
jgi:ribosomal protein S18 acetylase RimI-like enzyme